MTEIDPNAERQRLDDARDAGAPWRRWGPYLSERQWGTVREDYSDDGDAWNYFTHDQARSRAYRWGEDGLAGISDDQQRLCFALALWNGGDPILKERLFGLTNSEGNHGEDVKEYYFYLDSTPTHSYMKYLYKYPQAAFPYDDLVATNRARGARRARSTSCSTPASSTTTATSTSSSSTPRRRPRTSSIRITRRQPRPGGGDAAPAADALVPQHLVVGGRRRAARRCAASAGADGARAIAARRTPSSASDGSALRGRRRRCSSPRTRPTASGSSARPTPRPYVKDGINDYVVARRGATRSTRRGRARRRRRTTALTRRRRAARTVAAPAADADAAPRAVDAVRRGFDAIFDDAPRREADEFYADDHPRRRSTRTRAQRHAPGAGRHAVDASSTTTSTSTAGSSEHGADPFTRGAAAARATRDWFHMVNDDVISMPDKWEYPWYAAWDLAFHVARRWRWSTSTSPSSSSS